MKQTIGAILSIFKILFGLARRVYISKINLRNMFNVHGQISKLFIF